MNSFILSFIEVASFYSLLSRVATQLSQTTKSEQRNVSHLRTKPDLADRLRSRFYGNPTGELNPRSLTKQGSILVIRRASATTTNNCSIAAKWVPVTGRICRQHREGVPPRKSEYGFPRTFSFNQWSRVTDSSITKHSHRGCYAWTGSRCAFLRLSSVYAHTLFLISAITLSSCPNFCGDQY